MDWQRVLNGRWDRIDDEMLAEELREMLSKVKVPKKPVSQPKFMQIPGCPPIRSSIRKTDF